MQIEGSAGDLAYLAQHFTAPPLMVIRDERNDYYLLQSSSFKPCLDSSFVLTKANEELAILSGVLRFLRGSAEPLRSGCAVYLRHATGRRDAFVHIREGVKARAEIGTAIASGNGSNGAVHITPPSLPMMVTLTHLALSDSAVHKALRLWANDVANWVGLYRLLEVVAADIGDERKLVKIGWTSARQLNRFKHSANSVEVAGDAARHGKETGQSPTNPMSLGEATIYVTDILHSWFDWKSAQSAQ